MPSLCGDCVTAGTNIILRLRSGGVLEDMFTTLFKGIYHDCNNIIVIVVAGWYNFLLATGK